MVIILKVSSIIFMIFYRKLSDGGSNIFPLKWWKTEFLRMRYNYCKYDKINMITVVTTVTYRLYAGEFRVTMPSSIIICASHRIWNFMKSFHCETSKRPSTASKKPCNPRQHNMKKFGCKVFHSLRKRTNIVIRPAVKGQHWSSKNTVHYTSAFKKEMNGSSQIQLLTMT